MNGSQKQPKSMSRLTLKLGRLSTIVNVYKATQELQLERHMFHKKDEKPIGQVYICKYESTKRKPYLVEHKDTQRMIEINDQLIRVEDADMVKMLKPKREIRVTHVMSSSKIDQLSPKTERYFIRPLDTERTEQAFMAILNALDSYNKIAIVEFCLTSGGLPKIGYLTKDGVLQTILYTNEVREAPELPVVEVPDLLARIVVETITTKFVDSLDIENKMPEKILRKLHKRTMKQAQTT